MTTIDTLQQVRRQKLDQIKKLGINPDPSVVKRRETIAEALNMFGKGVEVTGRIRGLRGHGKIIFGDLTDESGKIQIVFKQDLLEEKLYSLVELIDIADFLAVQGTVGKTEAGELSIIARDFQIISKALRPLPSQWYGFKDVEERYRKRYLDLLLNPSVKNVLDKRWKIERAIRTFLWSQGYVEVETPVLQSLYGGTNAKPFTTHMHALDSNFYLRVAPELYLKRLIVGGYEKVFEIARNFRNEGIDLTHQPEFTMMEFYEAYADYHRIMDLTEELIKFVANETNGTYKIQVGELEVDLGGRWRRITIDEALHEFLHIDWDTISDEEVRLLLEKHSIQIPGVYTKNKALFAIYDHLITGKLIEPTWVIDYPKDISPLSKSHRSKEGRVERFEGYIGGKEIFDGWSEIVSPIEQRDRFETEQKNLKAGDQEAQLFDEDFLTALEHGSPPMGGIGIGIDRVVMLLTNTWAIREVIAFPTLRPEQPVIVEAEMKKGKQIELTDITSDIFNIHNEVKDTFPSVSAGIAIIKGVNIQKRNEQLEKEKAEVIESLKGLTTEQINGFPEVLSYRKLYKATGIDWHSRRPSPEALLRRIATGKGLYTVNTCVDAYNLVVMKNRVSAGAFDLDKIAFPTVLRFAKNGEEILLLGDETPTSYKKKELAYFDRQGGFNMDFNYRDAQRTMVTEETKNIFINVDGIFEITPSQIAQTLQDTIDAITKYCGGTVEMVGIVKGS